METEDTRRGDRVYREVAIQIVSTEADGREFVEESQTLVVGRHGAKILSRHALVSHQEIVIRCHETGKESPARIVGQIGGDAEGYYYGVELLNPELNLWGIEFPPLSHAEAALGRALLGCVRCGNQELTYLDEFAVEVLLANDSLWRQCKKCGDTTLWQRVTSQGSREVRTKPKPEADQIAPPRRRTRDERKHVRLRLKIEVCIRHPQHGEEVVETEDISRGGIRFRSCRHYTVGEVIHAALPYAPRAANIFAPMRIMYAEELPGEGVTAYGVAYIPARLVRSLNVMLVQPSS
jgi:hypothetical protein